MGIDRCGWVRARLPLFAGNDWLGPDRRPVERHLIACASCRQHLESLRQALDVLRASAEPAVASPDAPSLWPALARQIRESRRPEPAWGEVPWTRALTRFAVAATLLAAVFTVGSRRDVRTGVNRLIALVPIRFSHHGTTVPKRVAVQAPAYPPEDAEDESAIADASSARTPSSEFSRFPVADPHAAEPTH